MSHEALVGASFMNVKMIQVLIHESSCGHLCYLQPGQRERVVDLFDSILRLEEASRKTFSEGLPPSFSAASTCGTALEGGASRPPVSARLPSDRWGLFCGSGAEMALD